MANTETWVELEVWRLHTLCVLCWNNHWNEGRMVIILQVSNHAKTATP